ncbi:hypothetical protein T492DRAFT_1086975, partial [Pavlovales sp. CCMP2436]
QPPKGSSASSTIPRIVHLSWRDTQIPSAFAENVLSWMRVHAPAALHDISAAQQGTFAGSGGTGNPGSEEEPWVICFWTDAANDNLVRTSYPHHWNAIGGVYADLDFRSLQPLEGLLGVHGLILGQLCNAILLSRPRHPFWADLLSRIEAYSADGDAPASTGPRMLEREARRYELKTNYDSKSADFKTETGLVRSSSQDSVRSSQQFEDRGGDGGEGEDGDWAGGAARGGKGGDRITVAPASLFYPVWDEMQRGHLIELCAETLINGAPSVKGAKSPAAPRFNSSLDEQKLQLYSNPLSPTPDMHSGRWSHTWLAEFGLSKVELDSFFDVRVLFDSDSGNGG